MQITAASSTVRQPALQSTTRAGAQQAAALERLQGAAAALKSTATRTTAASSVRSGSAEAALSSPYREPGLQQRLGELQQGLAYTEQLGSALQGLKTSISQALVRGQEGADAALQARRDQVQSLWQQRSAASAGQLDGQLQGVAEGESARQNFRIRGLDVNALSQGGSETLRLALPGQQRAITVPLDGSGLQRQLQSLQRALAPTDLQLEAQDGELAFSVPESQWPALRDGLSLRGDGKRFPSGQMVRAVLEPQAQALNPTAWQLDQPEGQRQALSQLLKAQERLRSSQAGMAAELAQTGSLTSSATGSEAAARVQAFADGFAAQADVSALDYEQLSQLVPALVGLRRSQVQQLLGPQLS